MTTPDIAHFRGLGVTGLNLYCDRCGRSVRLAFDDLRLPETTPFPEIVRLRKFVCSACGGREVSAIPDWAGHKAFGKP